MTVVNLRRSTSMATVTHTVEAKCERCGVARWYTQRDADRGRITAHCQPCSVAVYNEARPRQSKADKAARKAAWYQKNKADQDARITLWRRQERLRLIESFGGMCCECGERDSIVLDFDHIHNDGHLSSGSNIIFEVKKTPERFQLLCKNCNWRKEYWQRRRSDAQ